MEGVGEADGSCAATGNASVSTKVASKPKAKAKGKTKAASKPKAKAKAKAKAKGSAKASKAQAKPKATTQPKPEPKNDPQRDEFVRHGTLMNATQTNAHAQADPTITAKTMAELKALPHFQPGLRTQADGAKLWYTPCPRRSPHTGARKPCTVLGMCVCGAFDESYKHLVQADDSD